MALIDRDRLLTERMKSKYYHLPNGDIAVPLIDIENAPTVDAVPVVHSEWIPKEKADTPYGLEMECAKCGFSVIVNDALYFKFCPNCGARTDGDNEQDKKS